MSTPSKADYGVLLYGAPATGKDTVTKALSSLDPKVRHFAPLKHGLGRTAGYRPIDAVQLARLQPRDVLWRTDTYGAIYIVDRAGLDRMFADSTIPVVHLGSAEAILAIKSRTATTRWKTVELTCPRDIAIARIVARHTGDTESRIARYDLTPRIASPDLHIDTSRTDPVAAAAAILAMLHPPAPTVPDQLDR